MADPLRVNDTLSIPEGELDWRFSRSSGPGGQGVNTTDSRVQVRWDVGASAALTDQQRDRIRERLGPRLVDEALQVTVSEHRSQRQNREVARERLAGIVAGALAPPARARRPTRATRGSQERRIAQKKRRGAIKRLRTDTSD